MRGASNLSDLLNTISGAFPRITTDFITPAGIDFAKLKNTLGCYRIENFIPAITLITDAALGAIGPTKNQKAKDFINFMRNSITLYSIMSNFKSSLAPSAAMENREEVVLWKNIGSKFGLNIPMFEEYIRGNLGCIPVNEVFMYMAAKLKRNVQYTYRPLGEKYTLLITVCGFLGDAPEIMSNGEVRLVTDNEVLLKFSTVSGDHAEKQFNHGYIHIGMTTGRGTNGSKNGDNSCDDVTVLLPATHVHLAMTTISTAVRVNGLDPCDAVLSFVYHGLDSEKFHYSITHRNINIRPNSSIRGTDYDAWVNSPLLSRITTECDRIVENNLTRSYALVGPPGTGKTSTCEHIMDDLTTHGFTIIRCSLDERFLCESLETIITTIRMCSKSVILLDDLDALGLECKCESVSELITFFDKIQRCGLPVIVFSTINNPKDIHSTIMGRSGRIDEAIKVDYPAECMVEQLLRKYSEVNGYTLDDDAYKRAAKRMADSKVSIADIKNLAQMVRIKHGKKDHYSYSEIEVALDALMSSRDAASRNYCSEDIDDDD